MTTIDKTTKILRKENNSLEFKNEC